MQALKCTVLRDGKLEVMDSKYLVPGDIVEVGIMFNFSLSQIKFNLGKNWR